MKLLSLTGAKRASTLAICLTGTRQVSNHSKLYNLHGGFRKFCLSSGFLVTMSDVPKRIIDVDISRSLVSFFASKFAATTECF